ncbi:MAG: hypothetical protein GDA49_11810 [Rhodospirillales bacterium]|nr:hypothetical protein [Rhodospirillales bacterium]
MHQRHSSIAGQLVEDRISRISAPADKARGLFSSLVEAAVRIWHVNRKHREAQRALRRMTPQQLDDSVLSRSVDPVASPFLTISGQPLHRDMRRYL